MNQKDWHIPKKYVYKPYSKAFPDLFQKEKARISSSFKHALAIEHIGSTAIPNLGGKGIIDIAIAVTKEDLDHSSEILQKLGYEFRPSFSTPGRLYFVAYHPDPEEGKRRYHIHMTAGYNQEWKELIGFRDYLLTHPEAVAEYASLKKHAAAVANQSGQHYRKMKEPMFQKVKPFIKGLYDK